MLAQQDGTVVAIQKRARRRSHRPVALSLFSGGGGFDIGVEQAGFAIIACIELDEFCCETLRHNQPRYLPHAEVLHRNVRDIDAPELMRHLELRPGELDLLFGGPPCQTFSQIGRREGLSDERGLLLFEIIRFARHLRPKVVLIENVKALTTASDLSGRRGGVIERLLDDLHELGYSPQVAVLNAANYGVPQVRERTLVIGAAEGAEPKFPSATHGPQTSSPHCTVKDALSGLPAPGGREDRGRPDSHVDVTPAGDRRRIRFVPEGACLVSVENAPPEIIGKLTKKDTTKFLRVAYHAQSKTLRCGEVFFHPTEDRYLTPREYMRIHGFPDDYHLKGPIRGRSGRVKNLDQYRQIANAVPPPLAAAVADCIMETLNSFRGAQLL